MTLMDNHLINKLQLNAANGTVPAYAANVRSRKRTLKRTLLMDNIFTALERDYDAYEDDIAILNIYFDTSSVMQFGTQASQGISNYTNPKVDLSSKLGRFANKKYFTHLQNC